VQRRSSAAAEEEDMGVELEIMLAFVIMHMSLIFSV